MRKLMLGATASLALWSASADAATFTVTFTETASGVEAKGQGAFDTANMVFNRTITSVSSFAFYRGEPIIYYYFNPASVDIWNLTLGDPATAFGTGTVGGTGSGDTAGFFLEASSLAVYTPTSYISGSFLENHALFGGSGDTFDTIGLSRGQYVYNYGDDDKIEVRVGVDGVVPLPAAFALLLTGLGGLGVVARRRRKFG